MTLSYFPLEMPTDLVIACRQGCKAGRDVDNSLLVTSLQQRQEGLDHCVHAHYMKLQSLPEGLYCPV